MVTFLLYFLLPLLAVLTAISIAMIISTVVAKGQDGQPLRLKTLGTRPNMPSDNPFVSGNPVPPEQLIGRYRELRRIARSIVTGQSTLITGSPHCGKTSVLHYIRVAPEETERANALYGDEAEKLIFSYLDAGICGPQFDQAKFWENVLEQPIQEHLLAQETEYTPLSQAYHSCQEKNFEAHELQKLFAKIKQANWRLVLLIDEFDRFLHHPILNRAEFFAQLRTLASTNPDTLGALVLVLTSNLSRSQLDKETDPFRNPRTGSPYFNFMGELVLGALPEPEVDELLRQGESRLTEDDRRFIKDIAGGHPYLLQVAASRLWEAYENGEEAYNWQQVREEFYIQVKGTLENIWQSWSVDMQKAFISALAQNKEVNKYFQKLGIDTQNLVHQHSVSNSIMELERYGFLKKDKKVKGGWRISPSVFLSFVPNMAEKLSRDKNVDLLRLQGNQLPPQQKILQWVHQGMKWLIVPIILIGAIIGGGLLSGENVGNMCQYLPWLCEFITGLWEKITALFG
jgi:hypothetical protein